MHESLQQWNYYREWAETQPEQQGRPFEDILRDLDFLYRQFSEEVRRVDPDPGKSGIQEMRWAFEVYDRHTRRA